MHRNDKGYENKPKICQKLRPADTLSNQENLISDKKLSKYVSVIEKKPQLLRQLEFGKITNYTLAKSFYYISYQLSIITSKVSQIISVMKT